MQNDFVTFPPFPYMFHAFIKHLFINICLFDYVGMNVWWNDVFVCGLLFILLLMITSADLIYEKLIGN